jgi:uncharacterized protein YfaT (DUF1175 family)
MQPDRLPADGFSSAVLSIDGADAEPPKISLLENPHGAWIEEPTRQSGKWQARIRAGILPGRVGLRIVAGKHSVATAQLTTLPEDADRAQDGTPDFLRLDSDRDRQAFRRWFTYLAEVQYFEPASTRPAEINDCAALIRYAYREALRGHDSAWANSAQLSVIPALASVAKYQYPFTPFHAALFRTRPGSFVPGNTSDGTFLQFADAQTLWKFNTHFVSRDLARAEPGDLLFFRQDSGQEPFHSMIYLGASQLRPDGQRYVLYHTGPARADRGEIRRLTVDELQRFPQPEWRPLAANPNFLGVSRWNVLRRDVHE